MAQSVKAQPLKIFRMNPGSEAAKAVGTIAICTRDNVSAGTAMSWLMLGFSFLKPLEYVGRFFIQGNVLTMQRNACLTEMEGDWILFVDDDMTFMPDALERLLATQEKTGADIVGGLCFQRGEPFQPTIYLKAKDGGYTFTETWAEGEVIEVDATGMAFCLITVQALRKIIADQTGDELGEVIWPDRETRRKRPPNFFQWLGDWGEDFGFCQLAKAAGCKIVVDTAVEVGHVSEITVNKTHFWREVAFREDDAYAGKKALGDSVGARTMTNLEALEKLGMKITTTE